MGVILSFLKGFVIKYLGAIAIEKLIVLLLGEAVKRTDSEIDNKIFEAVFNKTKESKEAKK